MNKRRKTYRPNFGLIFILLVLIAGATYINNVVVPVTPPLFIPTSTPTRAPESYISEAEALLGQGKMAQGIQLFQQAIQADPKNVANYITLARLLILSGNYQDAITNAENALLLSPNNSMAYALRGWGLGYIGEYLQSEAALKKAIELDPNNGAAYAYYAEMLALQNQAGLGDLGGLDKATEASRRAISLAPNLLETHKARGLVLEITGNYKEAIEEFENAAKINDNVADIHMALGRNYRFIQDYPKAVEEFNRANALNPADPLPDTYISRTYATVGEYAKAIQFAQQAVKDDPTDPFLQGNLGAMYYRNRQYQDALVPLRLAVRGGLTDNGEEIKALTLDYGRVAEYYFTYALTLARLGECGEALQLAQLIQQGVAGDEISVYNAQEAINICQELSQGGSPNQTGTPAPGNESTPTSPQGDNKPVSVTQ